jgi:L-arabinokinase
MYRVIQGNIGKLSDTEAFIHLLQTLDQQPYVAARKLFDPQQNLVITRAPGRLDVMGGIADYSGSMVLELPIREATFVALQRDPELNLRVSSLSDDPPHEAAFEMSLQDFVYDGKPIDYESARTCFGVDPKQHWTAYVAGVFLVLMRELGVRFHEGARILISSSVPEGKGVSSSAALEVAVMQAVAVAFGIQIQPRELALLCQQVENLVVGAPCGIMDQMTSGCGEADRLLALLCQPAELLDMISIPTDVAFWGIDSGVRHSIAGADYVSVRAGAFMGYRIIAGLAGLNIKQVSAENRCEIVDPKWEGYLANVSPAEFEKDYAHKLPERLSGAEFLARYGGTTDRVTRVDPSREYAIRIPTAHPIYEHQRVKRFSELLGENATALTSETLGSTRAHGQTRLQQLGELMYQSHDSYSACGLNSEGTDLLVNLVREAGPACGLYGAKITGGGSGGTVAILGSRTAGPGIERICEKYGRETSRQPYVFAGSSDGSARFGHLVLEVDG